MLSVMLPIVAARSASAISIRIDAVAAVYVVAVSTVDISVAVVIIIVVDGDVVVATPTAAIAPATSPCRSHGQPHTEGSFHTTITPVTMSANASNAGHTSEVQLL